MNKILLHECTSRLTEQRCIRRNFSDEKKKQNDYSLYSVTICSYTVASALQGPADPEFGFWITRIPEFTLLSPASWWSWTFWRSRQKQSSTAHSSLPRKRRNKIHFGIFSLQRGIRGYRQHTRPIQIIFSSVSGCLFSSFLDFLSEANTRSCYQTYTIVL